MNKTESREDYLETILLLMKRNGNVRSIDIANELNYSKPSISRAVGILKSNGYINVDDGGWITFTGLGLKHAEEVYEKHINIKKFLISSLKISADTAEADACKIEHIISEETYCRIKEYVEKI
ncbi:MAG: metal-dependent transcriptional regulator [Clostridium sp.]|nr:metal-dependent transcriptional regulator [Clostridium sp.]MCM1548246.1 metal-dependent transcriptional regulator [Ruminococcus sp.]